MMPRSVRVAVMGFPNVGKSGILNRLSGNSGAKVKSENRAGVTRHLQWVRTCPTLPPIRRKHETQDPKP